MSWVHTASQNMDFRVPLGPQVESTGTYDGSEFYSLAEYNGGIFTCQAKLGSAEIAVFSLLEATNTGGSSPVIVAARTLTLTGTRTGLQMKGTVECGPFDLTNCQTKHFVGIRCVLTGTSAVIGVSAVLFNARLQGVPLIDPTTDARYASNTSEAKDALSVTNDGVF